MRPEELGASEAPLADLAAIGDERVKLIEAFTDAHAENRLKGQIATRLAADWFAQEEARLALTKKYHAILSEKLSPLIAAQFVQIEHRIATVTDVMIASEMPLLKG